MFYITNNKEKELANIVNLIDTISFESYDKISFYNNAIIANLIIKKYYSAEEFFYKAIDLIKEDYFTDKSFISKIYLNGAILFNIIKDNSKMNKYLNSIDLSEEYDDYELISDKISFIKNNKIDSSFIFKDEMDLRYKYIYWIQILHFWDFDIPVLNEKIMNHLLDKISIKWF